MPNEGLVLCNSVMATIQTYCPENHESLHAGGEDSEDRWWKVAYDPDKDDGKFSERNGRHAHIDSYDDVPLKIGE